LATIARSHLIVVPIKPRRFSSIFLRYARSFRFALLQATSLCGNFLSKSWISTPAASGGGKAAGASVRFYTLLKNRLLRPALAVGRTLSRRTRAVIDYPLWENVQSKLDATPSTQEPEKSAESAAFLPGLLF